MFIMVSQKKMWSEMSFITTKFQTLHHEQAKQD